MYVRMYEDIPTAVSLLLTPTLLKPCIFDLICRLKSSSNRVVLAGWWVVVGGWWVVVLGGGWWWVLVGAGAGVGGGCWWVRVLAGKGGWWGTFKGIL